VLSNIAGRNQKDCASCGAVRTLVSGLIDYAGLFPPAGLDMKRAVENCAGYRQGQQAWMLGRFIVPAARLQEFARARGRVDDSSEWPVSVLAGASPWDDFRAIQQWNASPSRLFLVDTYEVKVAGPEEITAIEDLAPTELTNYYEFPPSKAGELLPAIFEGGGAAKIRTGGVEAGMFPSPALVADFLRSCAQARVPFKATAGLHHAMRGVYPLTYEPDSPRALMHGFLNVFLAAVLAWGGARRDELESLLEERDAAMFEFGDAGVRWRGRLLSTEQIREARGGFGVAFGSCSFEEPVKELQELKFVREHSPNT
jgi:hypothetical protein